VKLVEASGAAIEWLTDEDDGLADSVFTHDPSLMTDYGALILSMGKALRLPEPSLHEAAYRRMGIPILGRVEAPGTVEGGDCVWVDRTTLAIGRGVRTNQDGIQQVANILAPLGVRLRLRPAAVARRGGLPAPDVGDQPAGRRSGAGAFAAAAGAVLADAQSARHQAGRGRSGRIPRQFWAEPQRAADGAARVIAVAGFPKTAAAMEAAGCRVQTFEADGAVHRLRRRADLPDEADMAG
jgi:N-dimethylarginine dimethylaminohydrolase